MLTQATLYPTNQTQRINSMAIIRSIALFGILLMNINASAYSMAVGEFDVLENAADEAVKSFVLS